MVFAIWRRVRRHLLLFCKGQVCIFCQKLKGAKARRFAGLLLFMMLLLACHNALDIDVLCDAVCEIDNGTVSEIWR